MELTLQRTVKHNDYTLGILSIDGKTFCNTLEPTWRDIGPYGKEIKIPGRTAIPEGRYPLFITRSPKFGGEWLPLLLHVRGFEGIRIHAGNTVEDTEGCILVGKVSVNSLGRLFDSRKWLQRLMKRLAERPEGEMMWISIDPASQPPRQRNKPGQ